MRNENKTTEKKLQTDRAKDNKLTPGVFLEIYTLGYLMTRETPVYSNEILDSISGNNPIWRPSHGTYIPIINHLAKEGFIDIAEPPIKESENKRRVAVDKRKKYYKITDAGKEFYNERAAVFKDMLITTSNFYNTIANIIPDAEK